MSKHFQFYPTVPAPKQDIHKKILIKYEMKLPVEVTCIELQII